MIHLPVRLGESIHKTYQTRYLMPEYLRIRTTLSQRVQTSSYKMNKLWRSNVRQSDCGFNAVLYT